LVAGVEPGEEPEDEKQDEEYLVAWARLEVWKRLVVEKN